MTWWYRHTGSCSHSCGRAGPPQTRISAASVQLIWATPGATGACWHQISTGICSLKYWTRLNQPKKHSHHCARWPTRRKENSSWCLPAHGQPTSFPSSPWALMDLVCMHLQTARDCPPSRDDWNMSDLPSPNFSTTTRHVVALMYNNSNPRITHRVNVVTSWFRQHSPHCIPC